VLDGETVSCRWIVGADGQNSQVRRWAGLDDVRREQIRYGFRKRYRIAPWSDFVEVHWSDRCQIVVTPVAPDEVCLSLVSRDSRLRVQDALPFFPALGRRLNDAEPSGGERGAVSALRSLRAVSRGRVALVGDASGSVDALTGQGMCMAFQQVLAWADAVAHGDLSCYERAHSRIARLPTWMSRVLLSMENRPNLRKRALHALVAEPWIFPRMLATHVGASAMNTALASAVFMFGWQILSQ
jgi:menaquinone-9 beta-reductase